MIRIDGENEMLDALIALQNEGSRGEVAGNFKAQGNEAVSGLKWIDAKEYYTKALAVLNAKEDKWDQPEDPEEEAKLLVQLEEASYSNRALCNLELGMFVTNPLLGVLAHLLRRQETIALVLSTALVPSRSTPRTSKPTIALHWHS